MILKSTVLALVIVAGCASTTRTYRLDGSYGSLAYKAAVSRHDDGANFIYTVKQLDLVFDPKADTNATDQITAPALRFITSTRAPGGGRATVTFESEVPTQIQLDAEHHVATLQSISFVVPRGLVASSDYAGISVTDGRLLWPLHEDLRD